MTPNNQAGGCIKRALVATSLFIILLFFLATPDGLLGKADAVSYAICHRIPSHSLLFNQRPLPLCARCTGTYLGIMIALGTFIVRRKRASDLPPLHILATLLGFSALTAIDGVNSYLDLLPMGTPLYEPHNWLRLLTGSLHGLMIGSILFPIAMGTFWRNHRPEPILRNYRELLGLVALVLVAVGISLTGLPIIMYPLALFSSAGVLVALTLINTVLVLILIRRENTADRWRDLVPFMMAGFALGLLLIGTVDVVRFGLTGTLSGFPGLF